MVTETIGGDLVSIGSLAARVLLGAVFFQAGLQKVRHHREWGGVVANYRVLPSWLVPAFSYCLPVGEIALGATLWLGQGAIGGAAVACAGVLLVLFSGAVGVNLIRGRAQIDCGCFQSSMRQSLSGWLLVRNGALVAIAAGVLVAGAMTPAVPVVATSFGGVLFVLYLAFNEIFVQSRRPLTLPALPRI
jgi:hypothetical protein